MSALRSHTLSVALCTYNGERFVQEQLHSIVQQSHPVHEVVVCDDGSTDGTWSTVTQFAQNHPHIRWILVQNDRTLGYLKNFEKAMGLCTGNFIFLSDQDDVWLPNKVETMLRYFSQNPHIHIAFSDAEIVDDTLKPSGHTMFSTRRFTSETRQRFYGRRGLFFMLNHYIVTGATVALKRQETAVYLPFHKNPYFIHDALLGILARLQDALGFVDTPLILYRQHTQQSVGARLDALAASQDRAPTAGLWERVSDRIRQPDYLNTLNTVLHKALEKEQYLTDIIARNNIAVPAKTRQLLQKRQALMLAVLGIPASRWRRIFWINPALYRYQIPEFTTVRSWCINTLNLLLAKK